MHTDITQRLQEKLREQFGFQDFRAGQLEAMTTLMQHGRLLCIQPTGYGKSLLYQLPAMLLDGITLVVSPLLALMRDQVMQLKNRFGIAAASINTDQDDVENYSAQKAALSNNLRILFIAPEQLDNLDKFNFLLNLPVRLLVVDEAHCISTWGHDFRPSYRQIIKLTHALLNKNSDIKLLGLTATANAKTEEDIKHQLRIDQKDIIILRESMNRPNIKLSVLHTTGMAIKLATLTEILKSQQGSGLIYCATRENTELVAEYLRQQGINAIAYHAGIDAQLKRSIQNDFLHDKYPVITATNALGMGIDKSNLRYIIHFDFPGSITAYYQEVGRCGRDGLPAEGILLYDPADGRIQKHFIDSAQPSKTDFSDVLSAVKQSATPPNLATLKRLTGMHPTKLTVIVAELVEQEFLKKLSRNGLQVYELTNKIGQPILKRYQDQFIAKSEELYAMQKYAEQSKNCLMSTLRLALGDPQAKSCGRCSTCEKYSIKAVENKDIIVSINSWLNRRTISITLPKKFKNVATGIAVLDGKLRSQDFIYFMRERMTAPFGLTDSLMNLVKECFKDLTKHYKFSCIIPIPSRTWRARNEFATILGRYLNIPVMLNVLSWKNVPAVRQGELLNNDQRQHNVTQNMTATEEKIPRGTILLLDDYTGSHATLSEAARALRENARFDNVIFPFTLAAVKWRLGHKGMI